METLKLFLITKSGDKGGKIPVHAFVESSYTKAKLYFMGYIHGEKYWIYELKQIGTFSKTGLIQQDILITGGFEANAEYNNTKQSIKQMKLEIKAGKDIKKIFDGEEINEKK